MTFYKVVNLLFWKFAACVRPQMTHCRLSDNVSAVLWAMFKLISWDVGFERMVDVVMAPWDPSYWWLFAPNANFMEFLILVMIRILVIRSLLMFMHVTTAQYCGMYIIL